MALPPFLASIVTWLRAGYPEGVPSQDYVPLFALLASQLSNDEVNAIAEEMTSLGDGSSGRGSQDSQHIRDAIEMITHAEPNNADVARVRSHLAAGGWPLAEPERPHT